MSGLPRAITYAYTQVVRLLTTAMSWGRTTVWRRWTRPRDVSSGRKTFVAAVMAILLFTLQLPASATTSLMTTSATSAMLAPEDGCQQQNSAALAINAEVEAHNAQFVDQTYAAAVAAYNAAAVALN